MQASLRLQIEKLETQLRCYKKDNEDLHNINRKSEVLIELHELQEKFKERKIFDQENNIEKLSMQIKELKDESDFHQRLKNEDIKK